MTFSLRAVLALALLAAPSIAHAAPVFPPASGVGLEPPPGMQVATGFNGFQAGRASIVLTEMPKQAYEEIDGKRQAFVQRFGAAGADDFELHGVRGFLIKGSQKAGDVTYRKWILVLDAPSETVLVSAQAPSDDKAVTDAAVDAALHSIVLRPRPGLAEQIAALPFKVGDMAGFQPAVSAVGNALVLSGGPKSTEPSQIQPQVIILADHGAPTDAAARVDFVKARLKAFAALTTQEITSGKTFEADGDPWVEVDATGNEGAADAQIAITVYARFHGDGYLTIICVAPRADAPKYAAPFKTIALSVKPKA